MSVSLYFDPHSGGFYQSDINHIIPETAIHITKTEYLLLLKDISKGCLVTVLNGEVISTNPGTTYEGSRALEAAWVESEISRARGELEKVQDSDLKAKGSVSDWRNYRKALRSWTENQNFPNKEFRPKAPDAE